MGELNTTRVLGVLAGSDMPAEQLAAWAESAEVLLAADGGANRLHDLGFTPQAAIGDFDSIRHDVEMAQVELIARADQDSTDCDKLLALAESFGYRSITLASVEGDLLDHMVGTLQSAARSTLQVQLALRKGVGAVVRGPLYARLAVGSGRRLSVVPITICEGVDLIGAQWPLKDSQLSPLGLTSLSNRAKVDEIDLKIASGAAFVFFETDGQPIWDPLEYFD